MFIKSFRLPLVIVCMLGLMACGGGGGSSAPNPNPGTEADNGDGGNGAETTVLQAYNAMAPLCGGGMVRGVTTNETDQNVFGTALWSSPDDREAPLFALYRTGGWAAELLKSAEMGGPYSYSSISIQADSEQAADLCNAVRGLIFASEVRSTERRAYSTLLFYLSNFATPQPPWDGQFSEELVEADIELILNYSTGFNTAPGTWEDAQHQYLSMRVHCEEPFTVEQTEFTLSLDEFVNSDYRSEFCEVSQSTYQCVALRGVYTGNQCTYVVEDQAFSPVGTSEEVRLSFGGKLEFAPEEDWPGRPAYRITADRFRLSP